MPNSSGEIQSFLLSTLLGTKLGIMSSSILRILQTTSYVLYDAFFTLRIIWKLFQHIHTIARHMATFMFVRLDYES